MNELDEIIKEFLIESSEGLDQLDQDLVELEKEPTSRELIARIFRTIHTIKGTSGVLGFEKLAGVSHVGENLLSRMRDGKLLLRPSITSALLAMVDAIRQMLAEIEANGTEGRAEYTEVIEQITRLLGGIVVAPPKVAAGGSGLLEKPPAAAAPEARLGQILVDQAATHPGQVAQALQQQNAGDPRRVGEILVANGAVEPEAIVDALRAQGEQRSSDVSGSSIRVDVGLLDRLMNLVGELVLARNQVLQFNPAEQDASFVNTAQMLNLLTTELQEGVMKTRMQPIGNVWNKFPRVVRDLALSCGKRVVLEMEGADTELDKTIIEAIKDPLTHIVRNAVDHGIEVPDVRVGAGKPEQGRLSLRAFHEGGQVNIEISDDGAGISVERVRQKAIERGLVSGEQAARMAEREVLSLIFLPGLSTAREVTSISGRGVGMDVVKTNIEKIGGSIDVQSTLGQGTILKIKIPLTLAIIPALVVTSGDERFAIPQISLVELVRLEAGAASHGLEFIHGIPVYRLRGNLLPILFLNQELRLGRGDGPSEVSNVVVLQADGRQFGLVVDAIYDTEEIVVKPLGKQLKGLTTFAGATIMGDGRVALILDVFGMAQKAKVVSESDGKQSAGSTRASEGKAAADQQQWLIFRSGRSDRMAIPLSSVARLEEIRAASIERAGTRKVVQYRGQIMPLVQVAQILAFDEALPTDLLQVIVYTSSGRSVGLVVTEIVDVVEERIVVEPGSRRDGLKGSAVIHGKVTDLLDIERLLADPEVTMTTLPPGVAESCWLEA